MTPSSAGIDCTLLEACGRAYYIDPATGAYVPPAPPAKDWFSPIVGYLGTPTPVSADNSNACLVGENADGILDWLQDPITGTSPPSATRTATFAAAAT